MVRVAVAVMLSILLSSAAHAEKRIALLIGNQSYKPGVGALVNPLNDIRLVGEALKSVGFEVLKPATNATRAVMLRAIVEFAGKLKAAGPEAVGFLYYSGHGIASAGENYLVPVDLDEPSSAELSVQVSRTAKCWRSCAAKRRTLRTISCSMPAAITCRVPEAARGSCRSSNRVACSWRSQHRRARRRPTADMAADLTRRCWRRSW